MWIVERIKEALRRRAKAAAEREETLRLTLKEILRTRPGISGRELRQRLRDNGIKYGAASFYFKMSRLEDEGLIEAWSVTIQVSDGNDLHPIKERRFKWKEESNDHSS